MVPRWWVAVGAVLVYAGTAQAQSLADVARAEAERRKEVRAASKVYTNDDLKPDFTRPVPLPPSVVGDSVDPDDPDAAATDDAAADAAENGATGGDTRGEAYWNGRITQARSHLERTRAFATAMQNRADMLWTDFVNRDDPVQRGNIEKERLAALAELERLRQEVADAERAIADIEDEARRAGVPPGWLRPS